jgi:hypothetical protein
MKKTTMTLTTVLAVKAISSLMGTSEIGEENMDVGSGMNIDLFSMSRC